jgi:hypothetical protein
MLKKFIGWTMGTIRTVKYGFQMKTGLAGFGAGAVW